MRTTKCVTVNQTKVLRFIFAFFFYFSFLAHLSRYSIPIEPASVSVVHNAQRASSPKPLGQSKPNFCGAWVGGTKVCSRHLGHMTKMAATLIYGKNPSKNFLQNRRADFHETWYVASAIGDSSPS